jgi:hypothetical protein
VDNVTTLEKQFRRLERTFARVLDDRDRELQEYEDDAWNFFHACWHLKDWIQHDDESVPKIVGKRVEQDVESFWKLVLIGDLVNRTRRVRLSKSETEEDIAQRRLRITEPSAKPTWVNGLQQTDQGDAGRTVLVVVDGGSLEYPVRDLAKDAMRIWHTLFKLYGLNDLL